MEKVLSIIIPTYNMENYLNRCLDSLIVDNMDLLEVLVINDGSKDRSSEIAHTYSQRYPGTFKVIDKENGNYGSCINRGLKEATGKYVKILDADDSFNTENFRDYLNKIKDLDVDLILTDFITIDENEKVINTSNYNIPKSSIQDFYHEFQNERIGFQINMHAVTYKRQNLIDIKYKQTEGISYTDMEWVYTPMTTVNKGIYYDMPIYKYLIGRPGQTMDANIRKKQISQLMKMAGSLAERFEANTRQEYCHYLKFMAISQIKQIYEQGLLDKYYDIKLLREFDNRLKSTSMELYKEIDKIRKCKIRYVYYWRNHKFSELPIHIHILFKIRDFLSYIL